MALVPCAPLLLVENLSVVPAKVDGLSSTGNRTGLPSRSLNRLGAGASLQGPRDPDPQVLAHRDGAVIEQATV
jgi:hypothetical protein